MKKLISLTLATIMIFSVPMSSFAEETQTSKTQDIVTVGVGVNRESQKTDSKIIEYDVGGEIILRY